MLLSLGVFTALYGILAVIWFALMRRYTLYGLDQPGMSAGDAANPAAASYGPADDAELEPLSFGVTTSPGRGDGASTSIRGDKGE